jgi:predicted DNA-binding transcriptional regulator AlpA
MSADDPVPTSVQPELLTRREVLLLARVSPPTLAKMIAGFGFPPPLNIGRRCYRWRRADVEAFLQRKAVPA